MRTIRDYDETFWVQEKGCLVFLSGLSNDTLEECSLAGVHLVIEAPAYGAGITSIYQQMFLGCQSHAATIPVTGGDT